MNALGSIDVSGSIDCSGEIGFNDSGEGGAIAVFTAGDFFINGDSGVVSDGTVTAAPGGMITVTP